MDIRILTNKEWLHIKYYKITYQNKNLIYYITKKVKIRILIMDMLNLYSYIFYPENLIIFGEALQFFKQQKINTLHLMLNLYSSL